MRKLLGRPEAIPATLLVIAFIVGSLESRYFLDARYLLDRTTLYCEVGLMVVGMTFVIVCGQIDLSVASTLALAACVTAKLGQSLNPFLAIILGLLLGAGLGALNGILVAFAKLPSFLVTLATLALYRGLAQAMMGSESTPIPPKLTGVDQVYVPFTHVPVVLALVLIVALGLGLVLHRSVFGRWVYATGSNEQASFFVAVPVARVKLCVFVLSGFLAGVGGMLMDSRLGVARFDHARGMELDVITATVLGGASIYGGKGSMLGSILAFLLIMLIQTGMGLANITAEYQLTAVGTILIVAVGLGRLSQRFERA